MTLKQLQAKGEKATIRDFIKFYQKIPSERWITYFFRLKKTDKCCARGFLGKHNSRPVILDDRLLDLAPSVASANNGSDCYYSLGESPKTRTLKYLRSLLLKKKKI